MESIGTRFLSAFLFLVVVSPLAAREPAEEFVKGLEDRGLHELALEYLDQLKTSPLADENVRRQIPYLRGVALLEQSRQSTEPAARTKSLDAARQELKQFVEANPQSVQGAEAQLQLANAQMSSGQELVAQAAQLPKESTYDAQRKTMGREARVFFADARDIFQRAEATYSAALEKLPPTSSSEARGDTGSQRQEYRARVAQLRFLAAQTQFESAQSYPPEADEFRKLNESAAQDLSAIYDEFARTLLVGLYARLYEGRCYQAIGSYQLALGCYEEIIGKDNVLPPFRKLIASAVHRKAEVLIAEKKYGDAINACRAALKGAHKDEEKQPEWLSLRYILGEALTKKSEALPAESAEQRRLLVEAREAYRMVSKSPGEYQLAARAAATTFGGAEKSAGKDKEDPKTFQAAYDLGKDALTSYNAAKLALPSAERNNPSAMPSLQEQMDQGKVDVRHYFLLASTLVEDTTDSKLVNEVRYFLCWLYWESQDYYRAAVLGEFLARRYPDAPTSSSAAKIAMASFQQLYSQAVNGDGKRDTGEFEARRIADLAEFITRRWPGTDDADSAFAVLISNAIRSGRIEDAEKMLGDASAQSRPRLELQLGNAMWARYLELSQPGQATPPDEAALAKLKAPSLRYLRGGFEVTGKDSTVSEIGATGVLYYAQALLSDGKYEDAIDVLENKKAGPLALISREHPTASRPQYAVEAYKAALCAYVSVTPPQDQKAVQIMQSLERVVRASGDAGKAAEQLNRIYIGMGAALQKQMEDLRAAGQEQEAKRVAAAFAKFLDKINAQQGTANWPTRIWLAQTYYAMAIGPQQAQEPASAFAAPLALDAQTRGYLTKARDSYQQLLQEAAANPKLPPSDTAVLAVRMQLGDCYRGLGQYQQALDTYSQILKEKEASLAVQRAAALTYQERGQREDKKWFENAIQGGYKMKPSSPNLVWGWLKISQVALHAAKKDDRFWDAFYEARVNIGRCHYLAAMKTIGEPRQQELAKAKEGIQSLAQVYPKLGGDRWKPLFDQLTKEIERAETKSQ